MWDTREWHEREFAQLRETPWKDFEYLVAEAYRRQGYQVDYSLGRGADGGVDLTPRQRTAARSLGNAILSKASRALPTSQSVDPSASAAGSTNPLNARSCRE